MTGKFIVLEGVEGCGKSTQLQLLSTALLKSQPWQRLQQQGMVAQILTSREPGGTDLGMRLRQLLLHQEDQLRIDARTELLLYAADRAQHVDQVIRPALDRGCWVICDRFIDSTLAYQGYGRGLTSSTASPPVVSPQTSPSGCGYRWNRGWRGSENGGRAIAWNGRTSPFTNGCREGLKPWPSSIPKTGLPLRPGIARRRWPGQS
jgi:energy-coupling factor transporter ATP-binding protein EcfA2